MDPEIKSKVLRLFTYGLYVVTAHSQEAGAEPAAHGMLANFVSQVSFDPPLVMVSVENDSRTSRLVEKTKTFAINVLPSGSREVAGQLGRSSKKRPGVDKLAGIPFHQSPNGNPILEQALGWLDCRVVNKVGAGDSHVLIGEVVEAGWQHEGEPLTMRETGFRHAG